MGDRYSHYCVLDAEGEVTERGRVKTTRSAMEEFFGDLPASRVAMEVGTHSPWASRVVAEQGHEVIVANARQLGLIHGSRNKHDEADPEKLARLGRLDPKLLAPIRHRSEDAQADLALLRARSVLVRSRTALVNHVRGAVKSMGGRIPSGWSPSVVAKRAGELVPESLLPSLWPLLSSIRILTAQIRALDRRVEELCREKYPETERLRQVSGVGPLTSLRFVLTIQDPNRFARCRDVGPYLGLVPRRDSSGSRDPELPITKAGSPELRRLLVQSAHHILGRWGRDSDLRRWGLSLASRGRRGAKMRAIVAVARKLSVLLLALWKSGESYRPLAESATRGEGAA